MDAFRLGGLMVGDADSARVSLGRAVALAPDSPDVRAATARYQLVVEGNFAAALSDYRDALRVAPGRSDLLRAAGIVEMELNRWREAVADLEQAARLDPRSPDAASWLGIAYARLRRYEEAGREVDRALSLRPSSMSLGTSGPEFMPVRETWLVFGVVPGAGAVAGPATLAAYVALREDLIWALEDDQLRTLTMLTPDDLDGGRADWALAVSQAHRYLGDSARSRAYADSAVIAYDAMLAKWGKRRDRDRSSQPARCRWGWQGGIGGTAGGDQAGVLSPLGLRTSKPLRHLRPGPHRRITGDYPSAVARLRSLVQPAQQSRASLAIDRSLDPLRGDSAFQALLREGSS